MVVHLDTARVPQSVELRDQTQADQTVGRRADSSVENLVDQMVAV